MAQKSVAVLRCALCERRFSEEDVKTMTFFPGPSGCFYCYETLSKRPYSHTCFGKPNVLKDEKIVHFGYDPAASDDCRIHCPHKRVCKLFYKKRIYRLRAFLLTPFVDEAADLFRKGLRGSRARVFKSSTATKHTLRQITRGMKAAKQWVTDVTKSTFRIYYVRQK